jgi:hypothetical protein
MAAGGCTPRRIGSGLGEIRDLIFFERWSDENRELEYIEPGRRDAVATVKALLDVLDRRQVVAALNRLGLVPKQMSTGDRTILGRITKRGNRYLRTLFMRGARVILLRPVNWAKHSFGVWLTAAEQRLHHNVLATALANKLARIAWTVLTQGRSYEARVEPKVA